MREWPSSPGSGRRSRPFGVAAVAAVAVDADIEKPRVDRLEDLVGEAKLLHDVWTQIVDKHVGMTREVDSNCRPPSCLRSIEMLRLLRRPPGAAAPMPSLRPGPIPRTSIA